MKRFTHVPGTFYRLMDGVRRAKAAQLFGHVLIRAEVVSPFGQSRGEGDIPIDALRSFKRHIRRVTRADETRWNRVVSGAKKTPMPFPLLTVQPATDLGTKIADVDFDFGANP